MEKETLKLIASVGSYGSWKSTLVDSDLSRFNEINLGW